MILRKGAVSAKPGEKLIVPINMRDGSIICEGRGNPDWNYSAPHGAGRVMSRKKAFATLHMEEYKKEMEGIYSTSVNERTIDESPMAYKTMENIIANIEQTAKVVTVIKPIYNFKAAEDQGAWKKKVL
jgi:RNA-splicing ligase RtcB